MLRIREKVVEFARRLSIRIGAMRYRRALEEEVGRLRAENRALLNSILGIAGVPPVITDGNESDTTASEELEEIVGEHGCDASHDRRSTGAAIGFGLGRLQKAAPTRGRSWRQISQMLEFEALKTMRRQTDNGTDIAVPTRRNEPRR